MRKIYGAILLLAMGVFLGGCGVGQVNQAQDVVVESPVKTLTGIVTVSGSVINISKDGLTTEITSRKIDLKNYNGKEVEVTGEFSGTTLFVDEVK